MSMSIAGRDNQPVREFLTFKLGSEHYAVPILQVQEIRGYDGVTSLPDTPAHIKGIINLRGSIVPIIELCTLIRSGSAAYDATTVMIVVNVGTRVAGLVVDSVSDVIGLTQQQTAPPPDLGALADRRYVSGLATIDERLIILIDLDALLSTPADRLTTAPAIPDCVAA